MTDYSDCVKRVVELEAQLREQAELANRQQEELTLTIAHLTGQLEERDRELDLLRVTLGDLADKLEQAAATLTRKARDE